MFDAIMSSLFGAGSTPSTDVGTAPPQVSADPSLAQGAGPGAWSGPGGMMPTDSITPPSGGPQVSDAGQSKAATGKDGKPLTTADKINQFADVLKKFGGLQKSMQDSPLAQKMFQEHSQAQMVQNQVKQNQLQAFKRRDMASQILAQYGLL